MLKSLKTRLFSIFLKTPAEPSKSSSWLTWLRKGLLYFLLFFFVLWLFIYIGVFGAIPSKEALLERRHEKPSEVYSSDGVLLGRYFITDKKEISYDQISAHVISALLATEDVRFYEHSGIDTRSMFRVLIKSLLLQQSSAGGGSTITQQLAKGLYPRRDYWLLETPINKIREMIIAKRLEAVYSKQEILELYLNSVHMGGNIYGIEQGSRAYFNKPASRLKLAEAAVLVGMLKASTRYNPARNLEKSKERRNVVLAQMAKYGFITSQKAEELQDLPLRLRKGKTDLSNGTMAFYFREMIKKGLLTWCEEHEKSGGENYNLYRDGLRIYTTINSKAQRAAESAVKKRMYALQSLFNRHWSGRGLWTENRSIIENEIKRTRRYKLMSEAGISEDEIQRSFATPVPMKIVNPYSGSVMQRTLSPTDSIKYYQKFLNTGLVAMEPETGYVKAWVGGINFKVFKYDHVLSKRQVGSTFKPILYAAALDDGMEPCQTFENKQVSYGDWTPKNADDQYGGKMTMVQALAHSVNTISAQIIDEVGVRKTVNLAEDLGITSELPRVQSLALGTAEIPLLEMVTAYASMANQGKRTKPVFITKIVDQEGNVVDEHVPEAQDQALDPVHAQTIIEMMKVVVNEGSARRLRGQYGLEMDIAGKTGTTQNQSDGWFIGIIPGLVTGVWVGGENPAIRFRTLELGQGSSTALPIFGSFMNSLVRNRGGYKYHYAHFSEPSAEVKSKITCVDSESAPQDEYHVSFPEQVGEVIETAIEDFKTKDENGNADKKMDEFLKKREEDAKKLAERYRETEKKVQDMIRNELEQGHKKDQKAKEKDKKQQE
ncbi:penicillin-binding protein 1A [Desertivirga arenae]|uniref:penicillin-binding protein 1A n=1 Tax=Desertivirga arenae TaxID=2810309 RepID=UPI001A95B68D|nr:PBP1A family penicillin-binding protein [Pedobacter sp. SYSU D00823]